MEAELLNMFTLSYTRPRLQDNMISREQYLDLFDDQFEDAKVLCVTGVEGVGVTSALALYAQRHCEDCASYFNNGWSRHLLNAHTIAQSLLRQLSFFLKMELDPQEEETSLSQCVYRLSRAAKNKRLYFVFDGFSSLPIECVDTIKNVLSPLFGIENARFLFSGTCDQIKPILPDTISAKQSNEVLRFQRNDVDEYCKRILPELNQEDISVLYELSGKGLARNLAILTWKIKNGGIAKIHMYYERMITDFYEDDFNWVEEQDDKNLVLFLALLAFSEKPLNKVIIMHTLKLSEDTCTALIDKCNNYVEDNRGLIALSSDDFRKYLRGRLVKFKTEIELLLIDLMEKCEDVGEQFIYLPPLYKHIRDNKTLVDYLTSENVQHYLEDKKSQAAVNEQCEYGYNACSDFEKQAAAYFRFAINRSVSREIEKNELADAEIEALIAIGDDEKAFALTQNVFLMEERLKCLLIIAQAGKHLSEAMSEEIDSQINALIDAIDFEHIPDKALELAKLMMPLKMEKALDIIDKIAKVTKDKHQIDRLYTAISISYNNEGKSGGDDATKIDIANTRIADESLRKMASVMKSIMKDSTAKQVVDKMKELPTASSQLYFLRFWIPEHKDRDDIGDAVEYAVSLVIDTSTISMPKVTFLQLFCQPLPVMDSSQVQRILGMLDAVVENIKFPTIEYVELMILVISAVVKYSKEDAKNRLQTLYLEILDLKDKALQAHCKALLLRDFEKLGDRREVEVWLSTGYQLQTEIYNDVVEVLNNSAYHLKVVEGPIKALVCTAPTFVKDVIAKINTEERRSRAYLLASIEYLKQTDIKKIKWDYFYKLFDHILYDKTELYKVLIELVHKFTDVNDKDTQLLEDVKKHYNLFKRVEQAEVLCYILSSLYVWLCRHYPEDIEIQKKVKADLDKAWDTFSVPWLKVNTGYQIAKVLSNISMKNEAREYVARTTDLRKNQLLSSLSCVTAYGESLNLYSHSLGILIRSGLCEDEDIEQFKILMDYDDSEGDSIVFWSRVALEYYGINDMDRFEKIMSGFVSKPLDNFSVYQRKRILYQISPALYMSSKALLYTRLEEFDTCFFNACIENIAQYVQTKYPYHEYTNSSSVEVQIPLEKKDYDQLLDLMEHTHDDGFIFNYTNIITQSVKNNYGQKLSREIQRVLLDNLESLVTKRLPMPGGIQHNGYLIACKTMIQGSRQNGTIDIDGLKAQIEAVPNIADQAFIYALTANYLKKRADRIEFIDLAVQKTEKIDYTFDKFNRYSMCLQESFQAAETKTKSIATAIMGSLNKENNGMYSYYQRMLDLVRDHDEQLADTMLEMFDDDPARKQYQKRLKLRMQSSRKIEAAKSDLGQLARLNNDEQLRFFERQMEVLVKKKNVVRDFNSTVSIISTIFNNPITDTLNAVLFFMENLFQKNQINHRYNTLLREIHLAIVDNLKLVLAIASGTKEKLDRVNCIMKEHHDENSSMIYVGQADKGIQKIIDWYTKYPFDVIRIIDPYFHAEDLVVVKSLMDINNGLKCSILTNHSKQESLNEVFQNAWNVISAELTGRIEIKSCGYECQPSKAPWHDRWWLLYDTENEQYRGIRMASVSTLGSRISEISDMDDMAIKSAMAIFERFFQNMVPKNEGSKLIYDETKLR